MKRFFVLLLAIVLLLSACSSGTNSSGKKPTEKALAVAKRALEIADDYLDFNNSASDACDALDALEKELNYVENFDYEETHATADWNIRFDISMLSFAIFDDHSNVILGEDSLESYEKVKESRNKLAEDAGLPKRK